MVKRWFAVVALAAGAAISSGCVIGPLMALGGRAKLQEETIVAPKHFWIVSKVALLTLSGMITSEGDGFLIPADSAVVHFIDQLKAAEDDPLVKAVVLRIDSPGGDVTASDIIYRELLRFREKRTIPVYVSMMGTAASGAYYISMAADRVYAHPTTVTGSIGVLAQLPKLQGLAQKIGVDMRTIKSGPEKDMGSIWRDFAPGEQKLFQDLIDTMYERFLDVVAQGRPRLTRDQIRPLADGRVYTAQEAADKGLIDGIKYLDEVIEEAKAAANIKGARVVGYRKPYGYKGHIYAEADAPPAPRTVIQLNAQELLQPLTQPRFLYLWAP
ncbi:MAG: signal peptide peptidase SppA [Candidatus Sumerlaeota bacterium]|nr:signal peptide peptidase SppA [Candidatus Sumerlaeota bacterium]